jgi:predicted lipase
MTRFSLSSAAYLFGEQDKCKAILTQVASFFEQHPGYRLYVTGHSLGAALATLFTVEAVVSKDFDIPTPVTCINVASPKCGNATFKKAFEVSVGFLFSSNLLCNDVMYRS